MPTPIRITFRENVEHFVDSQNQSPPPLGKPIPARTQRIFIGIVLVGAVLFAVLQEYRRGIEPKVLVLGIVFVGLIMAFWYWFFKKIGLARRMENQDYRWTEKDRTRFQKSYRKQTGGEETLVACEFDEEGIRMTPAGGQATGYPWSKIPLGAERPKGVFVRVRGIFHLWFPRTAFASPTDYQELLNLIARKVSRFERLDQSRMAFVALGSNLGKPADNILDAINKLRDISTGLFLRSSLWQTTPVDCPPGSPAFVNAVAAFLLRPDETPETLLSKLRQLEKEFGRQPKQVLNEPRSLDLDLIAFGNETRATPELTLPHPRAHLRRFVLQPLSEIAPDLILPGQTQTIAQLLAALPADETMRKVD